MVRDPFCPFSILSAFQSFQFKNIKNMRNYEQIIKKKKVREIMVKGPMLPPSTRPTLYTFQLKITNITSHPLQPSLNKHK